jgi:hypothetical protein
MAQTPPAPDLPVAFQQIVAGLAATAKLLHFPLRLAQSGGRSGDSLPVHLACQAKEGASALRA